MPAVAALEGGKGRSWNNVIRMEPAFNNQPTRDVPMHRLDMRGAFSPSGEISKFSQGCSLTAPLTTSAILLRRLSLRRHNVSNCASSLLLHQYAGQPIPEITHASAAQSGRLPSVRPSAYPRRGHDLPVRSSI